MKLKFKKQQYQEDAAISVVKCFEGQTKGDRRELIKRNIKKGVAYQESFEEDMLAFANKKIELSHQEMRSNIRRVQRENDLEYTDNQGYLNFSIEMETGTGKTYTYIKTMYELNKAYGWSKFIIMVPSIAIREGVLKSFQVTEEHFQSVYHKKIRYFVYNSADGSNVTNINNFTQDSNIHAMIINYQAFNARSKANRRIYEEIDGLRSRKPIDMLKATNPILIIDEPQKMGKTENMLQEFNPLFILRYSATHKKNYIYNMIYRLDAIDAYNQELVKKINVKGIEILHPKAEDTYLYLEGVEISKSEPVARMEIEIKSSSGPRKTVRKLKKGDNLYRISGGLEEYKGYTITEIDARNENYDKVTFLNGEEITTGQIWGKSEENSLARIQIRETIKSHFEKEREYYSLGIKVLSLFFIDEVSKYKQYDENNHPRDGEYARIFMEEYNTIFKEYYNSSADEYREYLDFLKGKKVHAGYFSIDKKASQGKTEEEYVYINSKIDDKIEGTSSDEDAYDLIMKDKERLLSLEEPVRFIFSHSALREGWDNPNIFQICTLKRSNSEISKRQEIGRGLRICVNKEGDRMDEAALEEDFFKVNNLTVIASESYESFANSLQHEIADNLSRKVSTRLTPDLFENKVLRNKEGKELKLDQVIFTQVLIDCINNQYVDKEGKITQKLKDDLWKYQLKIPEVMKEFEEEYVNFMRKIFTTIDIPVGNENKINIKELKPNDNFYTKEFQKLWKMINQKTIYEVNFDSQKLIEKCVESLNENLRLTKTRAKITTGEQKDKITMKQLKEKEAMQQLESKTEVLDNNVLVDTKYDLIGSIARDTELTRKTIIAILTKIKPDTFAQYAFNPEEFIRRASYLIKKEKATIIVEGITYKKIDQTYEDDIFTIHRVNGRLGQNVMEVKKHIYDYLITDSDNERKFAKELEIGEVTVYAKLPSKFKIPTPLGSYNPDWAIVLNDKFNTIYFVAETKGSTDSGDYRDIEDAKIKCARKHFEELGNKEMRYEVVDCCDTLINYALEE